MCGYYAFRGSIEREEPQHVSYSIAAGVSDGGWFGQSRTEATFSTAGVPLYDGLQGAGARLPYKASWAQSVEWPLRLILNWESYVLVRIFLSTFVLLLIAIETLRSWLPAVRPLALFGISVLLLTPSLRFLRWEDWTVEWSQTAAIVGLAMFFLRRDLFLNSSHLSRGFFDSWPHALLMFVSLSYLVSGHPGIFPNAFFILFPLFVFCSTVSPSFRLCAMKSVTTDWKRTILVLLPAIWVTTVLVWELRTELLSQGDWTASRRSAVGGFFPDQAFLGVSRGLLPTVIERIASVIFSNTFVPLTPAINLVAPPTDFSLRTSGGLFFGTFTGLLAIMAVPFNLRQLRSRKPHHDLAFAVLTTNLLAFIFSWLAEDGHLPLELTPSGAYKTFGILLPLNILLSVALLSRFSGLAIKVRFVFALNIFFAALYLLAQLGIAYPGLQPIAANQAANLASFKESTMLPSATRSAIATSDEPGDESSLNYASSYGILMSGRSLMQSSAQIRNLNHIEAHTPTSGGYGFLSLQKNRWALTRDALPFFQIDTLITPVENGTETSVAEMLGHSVSKGPTKITIAGVKMYAWQDITSYADVVLEGPLSSSAVCPVLEQRCPVVSESTRVNPSNEPKLSICNDPCLWTYQAGPVLRGQTLVIPVSFDTTLTVTDSSGKRRSTTNIAGFLGLASSTDSNSQKLIISVSPDSRMYALVAGSYLVVAVILILMVLSIRESRKKLQSTCNGPRTSVPGRT